MLPLERGVDSDAEFCREARVVHRNSRRVDSIHRHRECAVVAGGQDAELGRTPCGWSWTPSLANRI